MKKVLALILALSMVFVLVACGGAEKAEEAPAAEAPAAEAPAAEAPAAEAKGYKIGFSNFSIGNSWRQQMEAEFVYRAEQLVAEGVISEYVMLMSDGDQAQQIDDIRSLVTQGCDAIIVSCITADGLNDVLEEAMEEGVVVVTFDNNATTENITLRVAADDYAYGVQCGEWLAANVEDGAKIIVLDGTAGTLNNENRHNGMLDAFTAASPNSEILATVNADWDYATAKVAVEELLAAHPQIDGVLSQGGAMTQAALDAFVAAGRDLVPMTSEASNGFLKAWVKNMENGYSSMAFVNPPYFSSIALDKTIEALDGATFDSIDYVVTFESITDETAAEFVREDLSDAFWVNTYLPEETLTELFGE